MDALVQEPPAARGSDAGHHRTAGKLSVLLAAAILSLGATANPAAEDGFSQVLETHVVGGEVDYPGIGNDRRFHQFVEHLGKTKLDDFESRDDKLAYLINAYNAFAIQGILDGSSPSTFFGRIGYFKTDTYRLGGQDIDLYDLEREVIIPQGESRIHFAINCASMSCPILRAEIYRGDTLNDQLDHAARRFINDSSRNRFDRAEKVAYLSMIFDWFGGEFANHSGSVQKYLAQFVDDPELAEALRADEYRVEFLDYDWSLNGTPPTS